MMNTTDPQDLETKVKPQLDSKNIEQPGDPFREAMIKWKKRDDWVRKKLAKGLEALEKEGLCEDSLKDIVAEVVCEHKYFNKHRQKVE